jgi:hypothetical protein
MKENTPPRLTRYAYSALLRFYPASFRSEFAAEMREVFAQASAETGGKNPLALAGLWLNELRGLPAALLQTHWRAYRRARQQAIDASPGAEFSLAELLMALLVFLLPAGMLLSLPQHPSWDPSLSIILLFLGVMLVIGRLRGAPLWSLPYLGIVAVIGAYLYLFQWVCSLVSPSLIANFASGPWDRSTYLLLRVVSTGMLWLMLFCLTLLVIALLAIFNRFQPFFRRVRHDWTLLSYILYGESVFVLLLLFNTYRHERAYLVTSLLCLLAGAWFYLRSSFNRRRIVALLGGVTLAMALFALDQGLTLSQPALDASSSRFLLAWGWMVLALLLPRLLAPRGLSGSSPPHSMAST